MYVAYVGKYCEGEQINLEILMDLYVSAPLIKMSKWFLVCHQCLYMH
jgi:hypothetical protein